MKLLRLLLGLAALLPATILSAKDLQPIPASFFGINGVSYFHYRDNADATALAQRRMEWNKQAGVSADRGDLWWSILEPTPGKWDFKHSDWLFDFFAKHKIHYLPILCYNAAGSENSPSNDEMYEAYGEYCAQIFKRYRGRVPAYEVWNEPNIPTFWQPEPSAEHYTKVLLAARLAAEKYEPDALLVGGSSSMTDMGWLDSIAHQGALDLMDVLSWHPYPFADGVDEMDLTRQIQMMRRTLDYYGHTTMPLWITEMGWKSKPGNAEEEHHAAANLAKAHVIAAAEGVEKLYYFNLQDWSEPHALEGWGLRAMDGKPKLTNVAYIQVRELLTSSTILGWHPAGGYLLRLPDGKHALAAWAGSHQKRELALPGGVHLARVIPSKPGDPATAQGTAMLDDRLWVLVSESWGTEGLEKRRPEMREPLVNGRLETTTTLDGKMWPYGWHFGDFRGGHTSGTVEYLTTKSLMGLHDPKVRERRAKEGDSVLQSRYLNAGKTGSLALQSYPLPALPGEGYRVTARLSTKDATGSNTIEMVFFGVTGWKEIKRAKLAPLPENQSWRTFTLEGDVPSGADSFRVEIRSENNSGWFSVDDLIVTRTFEAREWGKKLENEVMVVTPPDESPPIP